MSSHRAKTTPGTRRSSPGRRLLVWSIVCLPRGGLAARDRATPRRGDGRQVEWRDYPSLPCRGPGGRTHPGCERLPRHAHEVRTGRVHRRERRQWNATTPVRPIVRGPLAHHSLPGRRASSVIDLTSSSVRADMDLPARRPPTGRMSRAQILKRGGALVMTKTFSSPDAPGLTAPRHSGDVPISMTAGGRTAFRRNQSRGPTGPRLF